MTNYKKLQNFINEYLKFVFKSISEGNLDEEYLDEEFKFISSNNWINGFDFINWLLTDKITSIDKFLNLKETCEIISYITSYYEENYGGEVSHFTNNISPENILRHYVYVKVHEMSAVQLKELLLTA